MKSVFVLLIIIASIFSLPVMAANTDSSDIGSQMIKKGAEAFTYGIGDSMIELGSGNDTVKDHREDVPGMIFQMLTFTIDPYKFSFVQEWQSVMIVFFIILTLLMIILGGASVLINRHTPDLAYRISWMLDSSSFFDINKWISTIFTAIAFLLLGVFGFYYLMQFEYVVSAIITEKALLTAPPTIDNMIAYLVFAVVYLLLSVIMAIRTIIILLMAAGFLGLLALFLIPQTRQFAISAFMYFLVILFLQPTLLFIAAVGLAFISMLPLALLPLTNIIIVGLTLLLLTVSIVAILGIGIVKNIIFVGSRIVI